MTETACCFPLADARGAASRESRPRHAPKAEMLREHRRLLYVALTRAHDRLYVCGFENKKGVKEGSWYELARAAARKPGRRGRAAMATIMRHRRMRDERSVRRAARWPAIAATLPDWIGRPAPANAPAPRLIRPSDAAGVDEPPRFSPFAAARRVSGAAAGACAAGAAAGDRAAKAPRSGVELLRAQGSTD